MVSWLIDIFINCAYLLGVILLNDRMYNKMAIRYIVSWFISYNIDFTWVIHDTARIVSTCEQQAVYKTTFNGLKTQYYLDQVKNCRFIFKFYTSRTIF